MRRKWGIVGLFLIGSMMASAALGCSPGAASSPRANSVRIPLEVRTITLTNGMKVILGEDHRSPTIAVGVSYRVGSRSDPIGRSGLAHLVEHIGFLGSTHVRGGDHFKLLYQAGAGDINAFTDSDRTYYYETVPADSLDLALWLESDRMGFFADGVGQTAFENERRVVKNEHHERVDDRDEGLVTLLERERLFPEGHPYHRHTIGQLADLDQATLDDVKNFHATYYVPSNATLVLVGDFDPARARASIGKYFATLPKGAPAPGPPKPAPTLQGEKRVVVEAAVDWPSIHVAWAMPPAGHPDEPAIRIALQLVCGLVGYWQIYEHNNARNDTCWYNADQLGGVAEIGFTLNPSASFDDVLASIDTALTDTSDGRFGSASLAVTRGISDLIFGFEGFARRANRFTWYDQIANNPLFLGPQIRSYANVDRADMNAARKRYFTVQNRVITFVKAVPSAPIAGRVVSDK